MSCCAISCSHRCRSLQVEALLRHLADRCVVTCRYTGAKGDRRLEWATKHMSAQAKEEGNKLPPSCSLCRSLYMPIGHNAKTCPVALPGKERTLATKNDFDSYCLKVQRFGAASIPCPQRGFSVCPSSHRREPTPQRPGHRRQPKPLLVGIRASVTDAPQGTRLPPSVGQGPR